MMRHYHFFCAALFALVVLGSCQRMDETTGRGTKEVRTQFVFNISTLSGNRTKQSALETQATSESTFRGIRDAKLMTLSRSGKDGLILVNDEDADRVYDLSEVVKPGDVSSAKSRRVIEMSLPLGTNTLIFYGRAAKGTTGTDGFSADDCYGRMDAYTVSEEADASVFQLGQRLKNTAGFYATEKLLAGVLTLLMNTNLAGENHVAISGTATPDQNENPYRNSLGVDDYPEIYWSSYVNDSSASPVETTHTLYPLEEKLAHLYRQMTTIRYENNVELRSACGESILRMIQDLWSVINSVRCADPLNAPETVAKFFAEQVHQRLTKYFAATVTGEGTAVTGVSFKNTFIDAFKSDAEQAYWPDGATASRKLTTADYTALESVDIRDFPGSFNLPSGSAFIAFNTTEKCFYYPTVFNTSAMSTSGATYNAENYFYPAELMYFSNSPVRTSSNEHKVSDYPLTSAAWSGTWDAEDWNSQHVESSTRSVAMKYDVDYGVAMLETKVGYKTTALKDNRHAVLKMETPTLPDDEEPDQVINVDGSSFLFTGLVIGGQPVHVGWNFLPKAVNNKYVDGFVYDRAVHPASQLIPATGTSEPNYTIVLDNYKADDDQEPVNVALEFVNRTGHDFYGNCNLIQNGGRFYLIGQLSPTVGPGVTGITWPSDHIVPPYTAEGASQEVTRVFVQDFKTTVTFKMGENSLKYAYLTVPDLRASSLTLGLSVDITWQQGLTYDEVVVGGN